MSTGIKLSIVFLNFNRVDETRVTTEQLRVMCAGRDDIEIIAVDNGSTDGSADYLSRQPGIIFLPLPDNGGIAGYNPGFERSTGEFILVLDDDSCPADLASLDSAMAHLTEQRDVGLVAFCIESPDGQLQTSWHLPDAQKPGPSPFFIGCGFMIRRALFETTGWYPGYFFLYQNEVAVSFEVRLQGYRIFYDPRCRVIHRGIPNNRPGWRRVFYPTRNTLWLLRRYYPQPLAAYLIASRLVIGLVRALGFNQVGAYWRAVKEGLQAPVQRHILPAALRREFLPFFRQNSFFHQLFRKL
ncbi:MAG: glycosyltransferase family 2 protein [Gammaproteobacteria bacterium HGW-Gammaproteobacteria-3]|nr:MAG: glycosyltransferase family 2 protein [Gammaproteobacteria bacterium HGW-Gammaproteobacteria-3]